METQVNEQINRNGHNLEEVEQFLRIMHPEGERFEVRAIDLGPPRPEFFTDPTAATKYIAGLTDRGIYVTLNPVADQVSGSGAHDQDILRRHWMLIDCDPERKAGTNSTQEDLDAALEVRAHVEAYLTAQGFPEPLRLMSGNGGHLLYRIDLEPDSDLVRQVLIALHQQFSTKLVKIDTTVANASRITKVAGTLTKKGEDTPERPRRRAHLENPDISPELVPTVLLEKVAAKVPKKKPPAAGGAAGGHDSERLLPLPVIQPIVEQCAFIRHCHQHAANLPEPEWFAMTSIVGRCQAGEQLVHEWSEPYPNYTREETERKLRHALEDGGPRTCESIQHDLGFDGCEDCSQRGKITSPIQLGNIQPGQNYFVRDGGIWFVAGDDKPDQILTNFTARISKNQMLDDGVETQHRYEITATVDGKQRLIQVPAGKYSEMGWVAEQLGAKAVLKAGYGYKDKVREAIQTLEIDACVDETIYTHTGWRKTERGWVYLHGDGAIGADGICCDVTTKLEGVMARYQLKLPEDIDAERRAVRASLGILELGPPTLSYPLLAGVYRSVLGNVGMSIHLVGRSGVFKSEAAALCQQHYGADFIKENLPGSWNSTAFALEEKLFTAKDSLFVIDEFKPKGGSIAVARLHDVADQVFRGSANGSARARLDKNAQLRPERPSRTMILSTGEDTPRGESLRARLLIIPVSERDIDTAALTRCQQAAVEGRYCAALAGYVRWVASDYEGVRAKLEARQKELRLELQVGKHRRTADNSARLLAGFELFMDYTVSSGVHDRETADKHCQLCKQALLALAEEQDQLQEEYNPATRFCEYLSSAFNSGCAHLEGPNGGIPEQMHAWGWEGDLGNRNSTPRPRGKNCVGWYILGEIYIDLKAAMAAVKRVAGDDDGVNLTERMLARHLYQAGLLAATSLNSKRPTYTRRKRINGVTKEVLHLKPEALGATEQLVARVTQDEAEDQSVVGRIQPAERPA